MNRKTRKFLAWICIIAIISVFVFVGFKIYQGRELTLFDFFTPAVLIGGFFNLITWGSSSIYAAESEMADTEMGRQIQKESTSIGYYIILIISVILAFLSSSDGWLSYEHALYTVIGLFFSVNPVIQFFLVKKHQLKSRPEGIENA